MSDALVWELVKRNSCFLVKKGVSGHSKSCNNHSASYQFTSEPGNLQNVNSFTNSGLANSKAINIDIQPYLKLDRKPAITEKDAKNKPFFSQKGKKRLTSGNAFASSAIPNGARISAKKIQNRTADYRNDLQRSALARYSAVQNVVKVEAGLKKGAKAKAGRKH